MEKLERVNYRFLDASKMLQTTNNRQHVSKSKLIMEADMFEKRVLKRLSIEPKDFSATYGGYAILLSNWIRECYNNGESINQVVLQINRSRLKKKLKNNTNN